MVWQKIAIVILLFGATCSFLTSAQNLPSNLCDVSEHGLGALPIDPDVVIPEHRVDYVAPLSPDVDVRTNTSLRRVINSAGLPPVRSQGSQGSCTAWATAYYHRTHLEWRERQWDVNLTAHQCSPAFLYNHINGGSDTGSYIHEAMELICTMGCASLAEFPYSESDATSWPTSTQIYRNALQFRALNYSYFSTATDAGLLNLKQHIANGGTAVIAINVYSNFDYINNFNNTYCVSEVYGTNRGPHAVTVYGFDDERVTADGIGAFRLVNSWGTGWGDGGHFWMSYVAMKSAITCQRTAYFLTDRLNYTPSLVAEVKIQHNARGEIMWNGITCALGNISTPQFSLKILDFNSIQLYVGIANYQRHPFPNCNLVVDLSDGENFIAQNGKNRIFVKVKDALQGTTGSIQFLNATDYRWNMSNVSDETPVQIPDAGDYVYANVTLEPRITFEHTPEPSVSVHQPIQIDVHVTSILPLSGIWLYYKPVNESIWYAIGMMLTSGNLTDGFYTATIPAQESPGILEYYFYAVDTNGYGRRSQNYSTMVEQPLTELPGVFGYCVPFPLFFAILAKFWRRGYSGKSMFLEDSKT